MSITIYHNPQCSKSRKTLELIRADGIEPEIVHYLDDMPDPDTLLRLAGLLDVRVRNLLRESEPEYRAAADELPLDDERALAAWLHRHPKVLQRPVVVDEETERAVIGRPPENVLELLPR